MIVRGILYGNFLLWSQYLNLWANSQTSILHLTFNSRRSDENDTLPDCGHHGDDSFQEDHFSGIPTTLCINVGFFMITVIIFSLIRKRAWGYGEINADASREMYYRYFFRLFQLFIYSQSWSKFWRGLCKLPKCRSETNWRRKKLEEYFQVDKTGLLPIRWRLSEKMWQIECCVSYLPGMIRLSRKLFISLEFLLGA